jgi:hypothetical protein
MANPQPIEIWVGNQPTLMLNAPSGTAAWSIHRGGGNQRGLHAVDLQSEQSAGAQVASGDYSVIVGGKNNTASNDGSVVVGGSGNIASGYFSLVSGGITNTASGDYGFVGGGYSNTASMAYSFVGGGQENTASGSRSFVGGGLGNIASGGYSAIPGGYNLKLGDHSFGYSGQTSGAQTNLSAASNIAAFVDVDMWLYNVRNQASELRLYEPSGAGKNFTAFRAQSQAANITYTLPASLTPTNTVAVGILQTDASGTWSWVSPSALVSASGWSLTGNSGTTPWDGTTGNFLGTTDAKKLVIATTNTGMPQPIELWVGNEATLVLNAPGTASEWSIHRGGGNQRGLHAVDLQSSRSAATQVASGPYSVIVGGLNNTASGDVSFVGGGYLNIASGGGSFVVGGLNNTASGDRSVVGGGESNTASGDVSFVGGGGLNTASGYVSVVGGGAFNTASGTLSVVGGGTSNTASGWRSFVGGGYKNTAGGSYNFVGGGESNTASGDYSAIPGGYNLKLGDHSFGYSGQTLDIQTNLSASSNIAAFVDVDMWLYNVRDQASQLRLYEPSFSGTNYTAFQAQAQASDIVYTLPASLTPGGILQTDGSGNLSWVDPSALVGGNAWSLTGNSGTTPWNGTTGNFLGTTDAKKFVIATTNTGTPQPIEFWVGNQPTLIMNAPGSSGSAWSIQRGGGNTRGLRAVDLQSDRIAASQVASGNYSVIAGGRHNTASGVASFVGGGGSNTASGLRSFVGGGEFNTASEEYSFVGGGELNTASGEYSFVGGGGSNTASGDYSFVGGGAGNTASGLRSFVGGGAGNTASGSYSVVIGGNANTANSNYVLVFGNNVNPTVNEAYRVYLFDGGSVTSGFLVVNREDGDYPIHVGTNNTNGNGAYLSAAGSWFNTSTRTKKDRFVQLNRNEVLAKIRQLPVEGWFYKGTQEYHIGPYAEDFHDAFGTGVLDGPDARTSLAASDVAGVALVGVQALADLNSQTESRLQQLEQENAQLRQESAALRQESAALRQQSQQLQQRVEQLERLVEQLARGNSTAGGEQPMLGDAIPNPHDGTTTISCLVPRGVGQAVLRVSDVRGQVVRSELLPLRGVMVSVTVDMRDLPSGTYDYSLVLDGRVVATKQMQLVK